MPHRCLTPALLVVLLFLAISAPPAASAGGIPHEDFKQTQASEAHPARGLLTRTSPASHEDLGDSIDPGPIRTPPGLDQVAHLRRQPEVDLDRIREQVEHVWARLREQAEPALAWLREQSERGLAWLREQLDRARGG